MNRKSHLLSARLSGHFSYARSKWLLRKPRCFAAPRSERWETSEIGPGARPTRRLLGEGALVLADNLVDI